MYTRQDYMASRVSHDTYYGQFVTAAVMDLLNERLRQRVRGSTDPHFNDIALQTWDNLVPHIPEDVWAMVRAAGDVNVRTLSNGVCILKAAARRIKQEDK